MKIYFKITTGLFIALVLGVSYFLIGMGNDEVAIAPTDEINKIAVTENSESKAAEHNKQSANPSAEKKARIQALEDEVQKRYMEIVKLSGASGQKIAYEDNWCVASEDLSEEDNIYANQQRVEWGLTRGDAVPSGGKLNALVKGLGLPNDEFPGRNDEYLDAYKEADVETLIRLGNEDDMLALTTIVQSNDYEKFDRETRLNAAQRLVILGDTTYGLNDLIIDHLVSVQHAKRTGEGEPIIYLKSALVLIEYSMMRQDVSNLRIFLAKAADYEERLGGVNPAVVLKEEDFAEIKQLAGSYYERVDKARIAKGLPSFEEIDDPKIAQINYAETLSSLYNQYAEVLNDRTFPSSWKETYLKKTPCVARHIAMHNFLNDSLPVIQDEIAMLQQELK
jgi:hypothetical protein